MNNERDATEPAAASAAAAGAGLMQLSVSE